MSFIPMSVGALIGDEYVLLVETFTDLVTRDRLITNAQFEALKVARPTGYPEINPQVRAEGVALTISNYRELVKQQWLSSWHNHLRETIHQNLNYIPLKKEVMPPKNKPWYQGPRPRRY